jgi:hypothetical protein
LDAGSISLRLACVFVEVFSYASPEVVSGLIVGDDGIFGYEGPAFSKLFILISIEVGGTF